MTFKSTVTTLAFVAVGGVATFAGMISFPQMLPEAWAKPSTTPYLPSAEEVDAMCCERVKLGKSQSCSCESDTKSENAAEGNSTSRSQ